MQFSLDRLDSIVNTELLPEKIGRDGHDLFTSRVRNEIILIRKYLWQSLEKIKNTEQLQILAAQYHSSIGLFLLQIDLYKKAIAETDPVGAGIYDRVAAMLSELSSFIQRHFGIWLVSRKKDSSNKHVQTPLNEQEITSLLCMIVDSGIVANQTYTSFLEMVAPFIATRRKKGLSARSMLKSKDKLSADMKKKIKNLLLFMTREIDRY